MEPLPVQCAWAHVCNTVISQWKYVGAHKHNFLRSQGYKWKTAALKGME